MVLEFIREPIVRARRARYEMQVAEAAKRVDGFLESYPNSGRTWLRFILSHYLAASAELGFEPTLRSKFRVLPNLALEHDRGLPMFVGKSDRLPLIAVSHRLFDKRFHRNRPIILLLRDPRDVLVSCYFHQIAQEPGFSGSIADFIDNTEVGVQPIIEFYNSWAAALPGRRNHLTSYERLSSDTRKEAAAVLDFIGVRVDSGQLDAAIAASEFECLRAQEIGASRADGAGTHALRLRKGKVGGYRDYLSETEAQLVLDRCRAGLTDEAKAMLQSTGLQLGGSGPILINPNPEVPG